MRFERTNRIAEEMKKALSEIIKYKMKDRRLSEMCVITKVDVTRDLSYAKVYISVVGDSNVKRDTLSTLKGAAGYIRHMLGEMIQLRKMPELSFLMDDSVEYSIHISEVIESIKSKEDKDG